MMASLHGAFANSLPTKQGIYFAVSGTLDTRTAKSGDPDSCNSNFICCLNALP
jgi:hypothetical protein